jgi:PAS domain S-box-containing protein
MSQESPECQEFTVLKKLDYEELKHQLDWLDKILEFMYAGVLITDPLQPDNPIIHCNSKFSEITGYTKEEILGKNCRFLQGENSEKETINKIRQAIKNKKPGTFSITNYKKDGTTFLNELHLSPIFNSKKMLINFVGIQHDITNKKNIQHLGSHKP